MYIETKDVLVKAAACASHRPAEPGRSVTPACHGMGQGRPAEGLAKKLGWHPWFCLVAWCLTPG